MAPPPPPSHAEGDLAKFIFITIALSDGSTHYLPTLGTLDSLQFQTQFHGRLTRQALGDWNKKVTDVLYTFAQVLENRREIIVYCLFPF